MKDAVVPIACLLFGLAVVVGLIWVGYLGGKRTVCTPDSFPVGSAHHVIAVCKAGGGHPDITWQGLLVCRKSTETPIR